MKVIGILAQKGGAGKSTLTLHWAVEAVKVDGLKVAVVDIDPQGSAGQWGRRRQEDTPSVFQADSEDLQTVLDGCKESGFDVVFVDSPPHVEGPIGETARAVDFVVIPSGPTILDIEAIGRTVDIVKGVGRPAGIVLSKGRPGSSINEKAADVLKGYELPVCPVHVMHRAALADAFIDGRAVREVKPKDKGSDEIATTWAWIRNQLEGAQEDG